MLANQNPMAYQLARGITPNFSGERETYRLYQAQAQIIEIDSIKSNLTVNLSSIIPHFLNVGVQSKQCYYQIQSFQFCNEFLTFSSGTKIIISIAFQIEYLDDSSNTVQESETEVIEVEMPSNKIMHPTEICTFITDYIHNQYNLDRINYLTQLQLNPNWLTSSYINDYVFPLLSFGYDPISCKLVCMMDFNLETTGVPKAMKVTFSNTSLSTFQSSCTLKYCGVQISLQTNNDNFTTQVKSIMGFDPDLDTILFTFEPNLLHDQILLNQLDSLNSKSLKQFQYSPFTMSLQQKKYIKIKTSLNTSRWDSTGGKSNTVESFAIQSGWGEYQVSNFQSSRIYQVKETPEGIRNFQIYIMDENGYSLQFKKPYKLNVAIFFDEPL